MFINTSRADGSRAGASIRYRPGAAIRECRNGSGAGPSWSQTPRPRRRLNEPLRLPLVRSPAVAGTTAITAVRTAAVSVTVARMIVRVMMFIIRVRRATASVVGVATSAPRADLVAKSHENHDNQTRQAEKKFHDCNLT